MIQANLATYPPRRGSLLAVVSAIAPQVDQLNVVLNQYTEEAAELDRFENVVQIIPPHDTKDAGKFLPDVANADLVFLIDDDLTYPEDYVSRSVELFSKIGPPRKVAGYHCSVYQRPNFSLVPKKFKRWYRYDDSRIADYRRKEVFHKETETAHYVDQVGTGVALLRGVDMPKYIDMADSQKFVDVRLAAWLYRNEIPLISLPKPKNWIGQIGYDETIHQDFTKRHFQSVSDEILSFAFKRPEAGLPVENHQ